MYKVDYLALLMIYIITHLLAYFLSRWSGTSCNPVDNSGTIVNLLVVPNQKSNKYSEKAVCSNGPRLWNELLTDELRGCNSVDNFKKKLKTMLFKKHYYTFYYVLLYVLLIFRD